MATCDICLEIESKSMPVAFRRGTKMIDRFVDESDGFLAFPSVSPIRAGHLLMVPKGHVTSMLQVPVSMFEEFKTFALRLIERMSQTYGDVLFFEHGVGRGCVGGCGVDHAHWHLLPCSAEESARFASIVFEHYPSSRYSTQEDLFHSVDTHHSYLLFGRDFDDVAYCADESVESQYFRRVFAQVLGSAAWDWRKLSGWPEFTETYTRMVE